MRRWPPARRRKGTAVATSDEPRRYTFPPLEKRGVLLGLGRGQLATLAAGAVAAVVVLGSGAGRPALLAAAALVASAGVVACWPVAGQPPAAWLPVVAVWLRRRWAGPVLSGAPQAGHRAGGTGGAGGPPPSPLWARRRPSSPTPTAGIAVRGAAELPGDDPLGVVVDGDTGARGAVVAVAGSSFSLLDRENKESRLGAWGRLLASASRAGSPVHRLQWVESTVPGGSDELVDYLGRAGVASGAARTSYQELVEQAGPATETHRALLYVGVHPRRAPRALRSFGGGDDAVDQLLRREVRLVCGQLGNAELSASRVLGPGDVLAVLASAGGGGEGRRSRLVSAVTGVWPMASDEAWAALRTDGEWHTTYWVQEWPRLEVGPDFLTPLLLCGGRRRVALTMAPVDPQRAARQAGSARTADMADDELRRRAGFVASARRQREAEGVARREVELADGHGEFRFSGYVTVSAASRLELEQRCAEVEHAAQQSHLELRRLFGRQREAWSWTLPLGRGLA